MRTAFLRISVVAAAIVAVTSCENQLPTPTRIAAVPVVVVPVKPLVTIDTPLVGTLENLGDSIYVRVQLHDNQALSSYQLQGVTVKGDSNLGTFATTAQYTPINITFRPGLTDTVIRRYLQPINPAADTMPDSLIVLAIATDSATLVDTARVRVNLVSGPKVSILSPPTGDSVPAGVGVSVTVLATQNIGVATVNIHVVGQSSWPTPLDTIISQTYANAPASVQFTASAIIPANAPVHGMVTISATATDVNRQPGSSAPVVAYVQSPNAVLPLVTETVLPRSEISDSVLVTANGQGIAAVGIVVRDSVGNVVERDSTLLVKPYSSNAQLNIGLNLPITDQGRHYAITAFAVDQSGRTGYAVVATQKTPVGTLAGGIVDSIQIVHGRTFGLIRNGTVADIAPDPIRGNVYLSNLNYNRLEVWQNQPKTFDPTGVAVGSLPWGMAVSRNPDTLLVANSGGTNISRVYIGSAVIANDQEDLAHRILTRNTYTFTATEAKDQTTGQVHLTMTGPFTYSNRPQYLAQSTTGHIYYSTEPTATAPAGTIRWLDPSLPVPDPEQIWQYGTLTTGTDITYALFNLDSLAIAPSNPNSTASDTIFAWDHPYGQLSGSIVVFDTTIEGLVAKLAAKGSDVQAVLRLDVSTLPLEDTTYVQASGSRNWVAFGEGNSAAAGRVMMAADSSGPMPNSFSPVVTIQSALNNASDHVYGLAVDQNGLVVGARGGVADFLSGQNPFHLQLQGQYQPLSAGSGIAMHPLANGGLVSNSTSLAFVASATGVIEIVDLAHYNNRGTLQLKYPVYGPIRASLPMPGDPATVVLKLFAMSTNGLIVIDVTAADILPPP